MATTAKWYTPYPLVLASVAIGAELIAGIDDRELTLVPLRARQ